MSDESRRADSLIADVLGGRVKGSAPGDLVQEIVSEAYRTPQLSPRPHWLSPGRATSPALAWATLLLLLTMLAVAGLAVVGGRPVVLAPTPTASPTDSGLIPATAATILATIPLEGRPFSVAVGAGAIWVAHSDRVTRIDPATSEIVATIILGTGRADIASDGSQVWFTSALGNFVGRIDPASNSVSQRLTVDRPSRLAVGADGVWVTGPDTGVVTRIDPASGRIAATIVTSGHPELIAIGEGSVWVAEQRASQSGGSPSHVDRINPNTNRLVASIAVPVGVTQLAYGGGSLWVSTEDDVERIDPAKNRVVASIAAGPFPDGLAIGARDVWAGSVEGGFSAPFPQSRAPGILAGIDRVGARLVVRLALPFEASVCSGTGIPGIAVDGGSLWVAVDCGVGSVYRVDVTAFEGR